jgi:hypothetical protein
VNTENNGGGGGKQQCVGHGGAQLFSVWIWNGICANFYAFSKLILLQCICASDYVSYYVLLLLTLFAQYYSESYSDKLNSAFYLFFRQGTVKCLKWMEGYAGKKILFSRL